VWFGWGQSKIVMVSRGRISWSTYEVLSLGGYGFWGDNIPNSYTLGLSARSILIG